VNPRAVERGVWVASIAMFTIAGWSFARAAGTRAEGRRTIASLPPEQSIAAESLSAWSEALASRNPFRFTRQPAVVRFGEVVDEPEVEPERPAPLVLRLLGTIGGPPWQGVVAGFPGREQSVVVRPGDEVDGIRVRAVSRDSAVVTGLDSTWTIRVERRWP
jgi:hypothetical protein